MQHVMKSVEDKSGKTPKVSQHAGVNEPSGLTLLTNKELEDVCIKNGKRETHIDFCMKKQLGFFRRFHVFPQFNKLPVEVDNWITEHAPEAFAKFKMHTSDWDFLTGVPIDPDDPPQDRDTSLIPSHHSKREQNVVHRCSNRQRTKINGMHGE